MLGRIFTRERLLDAVVFGIVETVIIGGGVAVISAVVRDPAVRDWAVAVVVPVGMLSGAIGLYAYWGRQRTASPQSVPVANTATPARDAAQVAKPVVPRITPPRAQDQQRAFVPPSVTPLTLNAFFERQTDAQGKRSVADHIGKWMPFKGTVSNVQIFKTSAVVMAYVDSSSASLLSIAIHLWFPESAKETVGLLSPSDPISVVGRIESVSYNDIELQDCGLVE